MNTTEMLARVTIAMERAHAQEMAAGFRTYEFSKEWYRLGKLQVWLMVREVTYKLRKELGC